MLIPDTLLNMIIYIIKLVTHCSCSAVERVSTNFSDNPRIYASGLYISMNVLALNSPSKDIYEASCMCAICTRGVFLAM